MRYIISKKSFMIFYTHICLTIIISISSLAAAFTSSSFDVTEQLFILCWISNLLIIWCIWSWKKLNGSLFNPYIIFLCSAFIFFLGQAFLFSVGLKYNHFDLFVFFSHEQLIPALLFTILSITYLHLGAILSIDKVRVTQQISHNTIADRALLVSVRRVATLLFVLSIFPHLNHYIEVALTSLEYGYGALYEGESSSNIIGTIRLLFIPSSFLLLISYKNNKAIIWLVTSLIILSAILGFIGGGRGQSTALIVSYLWLWHVQIKSFKGFRAFILALGSLAMMVLLNAIGIYRTVEDKSIQEFITVLIRILTEENPLIDIIGELGMTLFPLVQVMELIPDQFDFKYGLTFLFAFIMVLPNFLRFGLLDIAKEHNLISLAEWLMNTLGMTYGPGFSILAEAFYNFGWLGIIFMTLFGYIVALLTKSFGKSKDHLIVRNAFSAVILYFVILMVRGTSILLIKYQFYYVLFPMLLIILLYNYIKRQENNKYNRNQD